MAKVADISEETHDALDSFVDQRDSVIPANIPINAVVPQQRARPVFTLTALPPRKRMVTMCTKDENGFVTKQVEVVDKRPFILRTMRGDEIYLSSLAELATYKLQPYVPVIDTGNDGEVIMNMSLQQATIDKRNTEE